MNKTSINWPRLDYTWNPVVGCKHGCSYCYAKKISNRFHMIPKWEEPVFFPGRLGEPAKVKKPSIIFVGSMCDLFGDWVPNNWIIDTIKTCRENPQHTFMFLTKNSKRYREFKFPNNCMLGVTITSKHDLKDFYKNKGFLNYNKSFISIEPLLGDFMGFVFNGWDLVIVGAMTGPGAIKPKKEWIDSIKHHNIFYKENIKQYMDVPNA